MTRYEVCADGQKIATLKTANKKEAEKFIQSHLKLAALENFPNKWLTTESGNLVFTIPSIDLWVEFVKVKTNEELLIV